MQAEYEMKVQVIGSQGRATCLFVNIPLPLAAALDLQAAKESAGNCWIDRTCV